MAGSSFALCAVYCIFLVIGGFVFMHLEFETEEVFTLVEEEEWTNLKEILINSTERDEKSERNIDTLEEWFHHRFNSAKRENEADAINITILAEWFLDRCPTFSNASLLDIKTKGNDSQIADYIVQKCPAVLIEVKEIKYYHWSFVDSLYFAMTVATTIGYGHIYPKTSIGKIVCIIYAIIGIPLTMILLSWTSNVFGERLFRLFEAKVDKQKRSSKFFIALGTIFYLSVGFIIFIFFPAIIFMKVENWTYLEGVYYSFITLTTIGFGDFVSANSLEGKWVYVYQIVVILWIMSGLGYWVMVANFITRAIRSKKMQTFARKATDLKKLMNQVGITQSDPNFLSQHSKASINFMLQLSSALVLPDYSYNSELLSENETSAPPLQTHPAIPGIAALFGKPGFAGMMESMASTTGRLPPLDFIQGVECPTTAHCSSSIKAPKSQSKQTFPELSDEHQVDVSHPQIASKMNSSFLQEDPITFKIKANRNSKSGSPNKDQQSSNATGTKVGSSGLGKDDPSQPLQDKCNIYDDYELWAGSNNFSEKL